jgi:site-specific DNA-methyltransferase (adenine-specific)
MVDIVTIGNATLYHGDCLEILPTLGRFGAVVSDPPYPNSEGHFLDGIVTARELLALPPADEVIAFWSERHPPSFVPLPIVAVHIWHRTNVNGKVYEPAFHYCSDGKPRRSEVKPHAAVFDGVGPGCSEYAGHPTQKPIAVMEWLVQKTEGTVLDPFCGTGSTGVACSRLGRPFVGIEIERRHFDTACERINAAYAQGRLFV